MTAVYVLGGLVAAVLVAIFGRVFLSVLRFLLGFAGLVLAGLLGFVAVVTLITWATGSL